MRVVAAEQVDVFDGQRLVDVARPGAIPALAGAGLVVQIGPVRAAAVMRPNIVVGVGKLIDDFAFFVFQQGHDRGGDGIHRINGAVGAEDAEVVRRAHRDHDFCPGLVGAVIGHRGTVGARVALVVGRAHRQHRGRGDGGRVRTAQHDGALGPIEVPGQDGHLHPVAGGRHVRRGRRLGVHDGEGEGIGDA